MSTIVDTFGRTSPILPSLLGHTSSPARKAFFAKAVTELTDQVTYAEPGSPAAYMLISELALWEARLAAAK